MHGNEEFQRNLADALKKQKSGIRRAMQLGAAIIKAESQDRSPVDTGNLKGGHYFRTKADSKGVTAEIGVTAEYAIFVHEGTELNFRVGQAKFLSTSVEDKGDEIIGLIRKEAGV